MTCQQVDEFLADYLSGELPAGARVSFRMHLLICSHCRKYIDSYKKTIKLGQTAMREPLGEPPKELVDAIISSRLWDRAGASDLDDKPPGEL